MKNLSILFSTILFGISLCLSLILLISPTFLTRYFKVFIFTSNSMAPAIGSGSLVISVSQPSMVRESDIVTFKSPKTGEIISHRIFKIGGLDIATKGDSNKDPDPWVLHQDDILGKVVLAIPLLGFLINPLKGLRVIVLTLYIPCMVMLFFEFKAYVVESRYGREKRTSGNSETHIKDRGEKEETS